MALGKVGMEVKGGFVALDKGRRLGSAGSPGGGVVSNRLLVARLCSCLKHEHQWRML